MLTRLLENDRLWRRVVLLTIMLIIVLVVAFGIRYNLSVPETEAALNALKTQAVETVHAQ